MEYNVFQTIENTKILYSSELSTFNDECDYNIKFVMKLCFYVLIQNYRIHYQIVLLIVSQQSVE